MTTLNQLATTDAGKEVKINENFQAVQYAGAFGPRPQAHSGLTWAYYGGTVWADGAWYAFTDSTVALTASSTNYLELDINKATPTLDKNTTSFTAGKIPLWEIVTGVSAVTTETDRRTIYRDNLNEPAYAATLAPDLDDGNIVIVGALTGNITINAPTNMATGDTLTFHFTQDATGSRTITWNSTAFKSLTADSGGAASTKAACMFIYDGTHWISVTNQPLIWL